MNLINKQEIKQEFIMNDYSQCHSCLSVGRKLINLGKYAEMYQILTSKLKFCNVQLSSQLLVCWECRAHLRRMVQFQRRVERANDALQSGQNCIYDTLSTLTSTILTDTNENVMHIDNNISIQTDVDKVEFVQDYKNPELCDKDYNDADTFPPETDSTVTNFFDTKEDKATKPANRWARKKALQNKKPKFRILSNMDVNEIFRVEKLDQTELERYLEKRRCSESYTSKKYKCETCITGFKSKKSLSKHNSKYHKKSTSSYSCDVCACVFSRKRHLATHVRHHYRRYSCVVCPSAYSTCSLKRRNRHAGAHEKVFQCLQCKLKFGSRREFYQHHKEWHEKFVCHHCGISFKMRYCIEEHIRKQHSPFLCAPCGKRFARYNGLWLHNKTRHAAPAGPAYCVECDKHYPDVYRYRWHLANSARHKPRKKTKVPCPGCGKVFSKNIYMRDHFDLVHLQRYKYRCEQCNKNFIRNADLVKHRRRVHEGLLPPKNKICYMCGRGFTTNKILENHVRTHTGERPFACALCPARFAQSAALAGHTRALHHSHGAV